LCDFFVIANPKAASVAEYPIFINLFLAISYFVIPAEAGIHKKTRTKAIFKIGYRLKFTHWIPDGLYPFGFPLPRE
jgi:hypothetical protein